MVRLADIPTEEAAHLLSKVCDPFDTSPSHEPSVNEEGIMEEGYSFQFWLPPDYDQEFMAAGTFGHYLWIDRKRDFVAAQFSVGGELGEPGISADERAAVMRALDTSCC